MVSWEHFMSRHVRTNCFSYIMFSFGTVVVLATLHQSVNFLTPNE